MKIVTRTKTVKPEVTAVLQLTGPSVGYALAKRALSRLALMTSSVRITCIAGTRLLKTELGTLQNACRCIVNLQTLSLDGFKFLAETIHELY
jgi:hypothetical protein